MNQIDEMDNFLRYCAKIYIQNPTCLITSDTIYDKLRYYGCKANEIKENIPQVKSLQENFRHSKHLVVYEHPTNPQYLQFHNAGFMNTKLAKLYVSASKEYLDYIAEYIFRFIEKKKIPCSSKVSKVVRADDIVLRIPYDDVKRVVEHINKDKRVANLINYSNPFALRFGRISAAYDDILSYNAVVAGFIAKYLEGLKNTNSLETASFDGFRKFYNQYYQDIFVNGTRLREYTKTSEYRTLMGRSDDSDEYFNNHAEVAQLFLLFINNQLDLEKYAQFIKNCNTPELVNRNIERYRAVQNGPNQQIDRQNAIKSDVQNLVNTYIVHMARKQKSVDEIIYSLEGYLRESTSYITREEDFRTRFTAMDKNLVAMVMQNNPRKYVSGLLGIADNSITIDDRYNLFNEAMVATARKYGVDHLRFAIYKMLQGDFSSITNESNYRLRIFKDMQNFNYDNVMFFCKLYLHDRGYNLNTVPNIVEAYIMQITNDYVNVRTNGTI